VAGATNGDLSRARRGSYTGAWLTSTARGGWNDVDGRPAVVRAWLPRFGGGNFEKTLDRERRSR
jgi:hypothetical protein